MENKLQKVAPKVQFIEIDADRAGQRVDNFLIGLLKRVPKTLIYRILRKGEVRVNKGRVKADYKLKAGDVVRVPPVRVPDGKTVPNASEQLKQLLAGAVLYENKGLLIINKPSGLAVHGGSGINLGLIEVSRQMRPDDHYLELVHRLDRDTSGCIMIAKKRSMLRHLHKDLREGRIQKHYQALVHGAWPARCRSVDAPLRKTELSNAERIVRVDPEGKPSLTRFKILQRYEQCTLVEAKPITGRTHQIRVHAHHMGHSLVGDPKYGDDDRNLSLRAAGFNRLFLHAAGLSLFLPDAEEPIWVEAPLDEKLAEPLQRLQRR